MNYNVYLKYIIDIYIYLSSFIYLMFEQNIECANIYINLFNIIFNDKKMLCEKCLSYESYLVSFSEFVYIFG